MKFSLFTLVIGFTSFYADAMVLPLLARNAVAAQQRTQVSQFHTNVPKFFTHVTPKETPRFVYDQAQPLLERAQNLWDRSDKELAQELSASFAGGEFDSQMVRAFRLETSLHALDRDLQDLSRFYSHAVHSDSSKPDIPQDKIISAWTLIRTILLRVKPHLKYD